MGMMQMQVQQPCNACGGKGKTAATKCPRCGGKRLTRESKPFKVDVAKGMANNDQVVFEKQGEQVPDMITGDLIFTLR
jgi:DnaJ-class molecular chaperone